MRKPDSKQAVDDPASIQSRIARLEEGQRLLRNMLTRSLWTTLDRLDEVTLAGRRMTCPICDRAEPREALELRVDHCRFGGGRLERYVCPGCGCIYGPAKCLELDPDLLSADYALLYADYAEADSTENEIRAFRSLNPRPGGLYLDWGCGHWSQTVPRLRAEGYEVWGYEPTITSEGSTFVVARRDQISAVFEGIFSNNVIEHMVRPVREFRYFHRILAPGGKMAHASPCYRYDYAFSRFHVVFLTGNSPQVLAQRSGFRVVAREEDGEFINCVFERLPSLPTDAG
jgi:SAM-dependent methyltransferase